jgi:hypothetical protein
VRYALVSVMYFYVFDAWADPNLGKRIESETQLSSTYVHATGLIGENL